MNSSRLLDTNRHEKRRTQSHETLEQFRMLGIERIKNGENPRVVAKSFGMHRSWGYRIAGKAAGRGRGKRVLKSTVCTGRPRKLTAQQESEVFRCMDGKHPHQYGFDFALWTRTIVAAFILERFEPVPEVWTPKKVIVGLFAQHV